MNLNSHPHPYGIVIAGNDMGTDQESYLYCAAYGDGHSSCAGSGRGVSNEPPQGEENAACTNHSPGQPGLVGDRSVLKGDDAR